MGSQNLSVIIKSEFLRIILRPGQFSRRSVGCGSTGNSRDRLSNRLARVFLKDMIMIASKLNSQASENRIETLRSNLGISDAHWEEKKSK